MEQPKRFESWKEIESYLKRDVRTLRRWEKNEGLPIHRHAHRSRNSVYAYAHEIDAWRASRRAGKGMPADVPSKAPRFARFTAAMVAAFACLIMSGSGIRSVSAQSLREPFVPRVVFNNDPGDGEEDISLNGRWMVRTDWETGDLEILDLPSKRARRLLVKAGVWADQDGGYAENPVFSPDAKQILYVWDTDRPNSVQLRVVANQRGAKPRVLVDSRDIEWFYPGGWAPDRKSAVVRIERHDRSSDLALVSTVDGTIKVLKSLESRTSVRTVERPRISPDGDYIAYAALTSSPKAGSPPSESIDQHIYLISLKGETETELVKTTGINENPVWTADGNHILFISNRSGSFDLWSQAIRNGKADGDPFLVVREIGRAFLPSVRAGEYYYSIKRSAVEFVHIADLRSSDKKIVESFVGLAPAWSPDGKTIAFKRHRTASDQYDLVVHTLETGEERVLTSPPSYTGEGRPGWFHDGRRILTGIASPGNAFQFYTVDVNTKDWRPTLAGTPRISAISVDDRALYFTPSKTKQIEVITLASGQKEAFPIPEGNVENFSLSPDGRTLVLRRIHPVLKQTQIALVGVDGSAYRVIYRDPMTNQHSLAWSSDGRYLFFAKAINKKWEILSIPVEGGTPETIGIDSVDPIRFVDVSPDGSRLAFSVQSNGSERRALRLGALK